MFFEEFVRRYGILVPAEERLATDDIREVEGFMGVFWGIE